MTLKSSFGVAAFVALSAVPSALSAQSGNYFLDARDPNNFFQIVLGRGQWTIGVVGGGWSPWSYVQGCDANGANCHTGYHTIFAYLLGHRPVRFHGIDNNFNCATTPCSMYATPQLALSHALPPLALNIHAPTMFKAWINDCCYGDNSGGLTIGVVNATATVTPEPASVLLFATGLVALGSLRLKRRKKRDVLS